MATVIGAAALTVMCLFAFLAIAVVVMSAWQVFRPRRCAKTEHPAGRVACTECNPHRV